MSKEHSSGFLAFLAIVAVIGSGAGVLIYQGLQKEHQPDTSGFDVAQTEGPKKISRVETQKTGSSLGMIRGGLPLQPSSGPSVSPQQKSISNFTSLCRSNEGRVRALAEAYTKRFPTIAQYGRDWMSYPDLKKLNNDYMSDHDPVKFLRGLVASKNFPILLRKYAGRSEIQSFVKESMRQAPQELVSGAMDYLGKDGTVKVLIRNIAQSLGLPGDILDATSEKPQIDQQKVLNSVIQSHPELQKALNNQSN